VQGLSSSAALPGFARTQDLPSGAAGRLGPDPGLAQADFGEALAEIAGVECSNGFATTMATPAGSSLFRRLRAKPGKKIVDRHAANPNSWKTPVMAIWMVR
jgi:hypothetical protein